VGLFQGKAEQNQKQILALVPSEKHAPNTDPAEREARTKQLSLPAFMDFHCIARPREFARLGASTGRNLEND
jgi:hypothetical protein